MSESVESHETRVGNSIKEVVNVTCPNDKGGRPKVKIDVHALIICFVKYLNGFNECANDRLKHLFKNI